jgi:hypothetical protein
LFNNADWVGIGLGILGVLVSAGGLGIAIVQLKRIKTATYAVNEAVVRQRSELSAQLLLTRAGELERIESDLRAASTMPESIARQVATQAVLGWRRTGIDFQALARRQGSPRELVTAMGASLAIVDVALGDLNDPATPVPDACSALLTKMSAACTKAREAGSAMILSEHQ